MFILPTQFLGPWISVLFSYVQIGNPRCGFCCYMSGFVALFIAFWCFYFLTDMVLMISHFSLRLESKWALVLGKKITTTSFPCWWWGWWYWRGMWSFWPGKERERSDKERKKRKESKGGEKMSPLTGIVALVDYRWRRYRKGVKDKERERESATLFLSLSLTLLFLGMRWVS